MWRRALEPKAPGFDIGHLRVDSPRAFRPLTSPAAIPLAESEWPGESLVLAAEAGGEARAYPVAMMRVHHLVNDTLGGSPFLVTFCGNCFSGAAFDPTVSGRALTFRLGGGYGGAFLLRDDQTKTLWAQMTGEALVGRMVGTSMDLLPLHLTSVKDWLAVHPHSLTPNASVGSFRDYRPPGTGSIKAKWLSTVPRLDPRAEMRAFGLGVVANGKACAYLFDGGTDGGTRGLRFHQADIGGVPIVLLALPGAWPLAYERRVDGEVIDLHLVDGRVVDDSGTEWDGAGRAIGGPRTGALLRPLKSHVTEWYAWAAYYPETDLVDLSPSFSERS